MSTIEMPEHFTEDQIQKAIARTNKHLESVGGEKITGYTIKKSVCSVKTSDHPPCQCGSTDFLRTGTCHVCTVCGSSQGCS